MATKMIGKVRRARKVDPNGNIYYDRGVSDVIIDPERGISVKDDIDELRKGLAVALKFVAANPKGMDGKSPYEIAQDHGFEGTEYEWLLSLKGDPGSDGLNAYELACTFFGFTGTMKAYMESLKGEKGDTGKSAYEFALEYGFEGTEEDWVRFNTKTPITDEEILEIYNRLTTGSTEGTGDDYQGLSDSIGAINEKITTMDEALQQTMNDVQINSNILTGYKTNGEEFQRQILDIASEEDVNEVLDAEDNKTEEEESS